MLLSSFIASISSFFRLFSNLQAQSWCFLLAPNSTCTRLVISTWPSFKFSNLTHLKLHLSFSFKTGSCSSDPFVLMTLPSSKFGNTSKVCNRSWLVSHCHSSSLAGYTSRISLESSFPLLSVAQGWGLKFCISNMLLNQADGAGLGFDKQGPALGWQWPPDLVACFPVHGQI